MVDEAAFAALVAAIDGLDAAQRIRVFEALALAEAADRGAVAGERLLPAAAGDMPGESLMARIGRERLDSFGCPHCGLRNVHRWGSAGGKPRYRCKDCRKTFNPLTGTPLSGLHYPQRWREQAQAMLDGVTIQQAAKRCGIDYSTAFRWRHRFLAALNFDKPQHLSGIVEADETFILESFKGRRGMLGRAPRKRGGKASKRGMSSEQIPVLVARDRSGATIDAVLRGLDGASMQAALGHVIIRGADFCCDGGMGITAFARRARVKLHVLPAPGGPKPGAPQFQINNVNAYHSRLKEWMRRFHGVATNNLPNYLSWRRTIEALARTATPEAWIMGAAGLGPYQQASA